MDQSIMDRMKESKSAGSSDQDSSEEKMMEMWDMMDDKQKEECLTMMEKMTNYNEAGDSEPSGNGKGGVAIVISAKK